MIARGIEPVTLAKLMGHHEDVRQTLNTYAGLLNRVRTDYAVRKAIAPWVSAVHDVRPRRTVEPMESSAPLWRRRFG